MAAPATRASLALAALTLLCAPLPARAETDHAATLSEIQTLTTEAATAFENYSYRKAQAKLERALTLAASAGISRDPKLAEVHVMLGVAAIAGASDLYRGLHAFVQALRLNPKASIPKKVVTPQLTEMFNRARQSVKEIGKPPTIRLAQTARPAGAAGSTDPAKAKAAVSGLVHTPIDNAKRGYPILVKVEAGVDIQAQRVFVYYRKAGTVEFNKLDMQKTGTVFRVAIPAEATVGRYVHYYLEARDQRGRLAASFGSARSPTVTIID